MAKKRDFLPQELTERFDVEGHVGRRDRIETYIGHRRTDGLTVILRIDRESPTSPRERRHLEESWLRIRRLRHPGLVRPLRLGMPRSGGHYVVHEFAPGVNLRNLAPHLDFEAVVDILGKLLPALHLLHLHKIVHQRISPEKVIVDGMGPDRRVRLVDPLVSPRRDGRRWSPETYRAPEVEGDGRYDGRADLYSLAVTLFEVLSGSHPFPDGVGPTFAGLEEFRDVPPLSGPRSDCPKVLEEILLKMGSEDPRSRPRNAWALHRELPRTGLFRNPTPNLTVREAVESLLHRATEVRVKAVLDALPEGPLPTQVEAPDSLGDVAEEIRAVAALHRPRRMIRLNGSSARDGGGTRTRRANYPDEKRLVLLPRRSRPRTPPAEKERSGANPKELRVHVPVGPTPEEQTRFVRTFMRGPIESRRGKYLSRWLHWRAEGRQERYAKTLSPFLDWQRGELHMNWSRLGESVVRSLLHAPRIVQGDFPLRTLEENAALLTRRLLPAQAARIVSVLARREPNSLRSETRRARLELHGAILFMKGAEMERSANRFRRTARQIATRWPIFATHLRLRAIQVQSLSRRTKRSVLAEMARQEIRQHRQGKRWSNDLLAGLHGRLIIVRMLQAKGKLEEARHELTTIRRDRRDTRHEGRSQETGYYKERMTKSVEAEMCRLSAASRFLASGAEKAKRMCAVLRGKPALTASVMTGYRHNQVLEAIDLRLGGATAALRRAIGMARQAMATGYCPGAAEAMYAMACAWAQYGNDDRSLEWMDNSIKEAGDTKRQTRLDGLSLLNMRTGQYQAAGARALEAVRESVQSGAVRMHQDSLAVYAASRRLMGRPASAARAALRCLRTGRGFYRKSDHLEGALLDALGWIGTDDEMMWAVSRMRSTERLAREICLHTLRWPNRVEVLGGLSAEDALRVRTLREGIENKARNLTAKAIQECVEADASGKHLERLRTSTLAEVLARRVVWIPNEEIARDFKLGFRVVRDCSALGLLFEQARLARCLALRAAAMGWVTECKAAIMLASAARRRMRVPQETSGRTGPIQAVCLDSCEEMLDLWVKEADRMQRKIRALMGAAHEAGCKGCPGASSEVGRRGRRMAELMEAMMCTSSVSFTFGAYEGKKEIIIGHSNRGSSMCWHDVSVGVRLMSRMGSRKPFVFRGHSGEVLMAAASTTGRELIIAAGQLGGAQSVEELLTVQKVASVCLSEFESVVRSSEVRHVAIVSAPGVNDSSVVDELPLESSEKVCKSPGLRSVIEIGVRLANSGVPVLLSGESGVGKEVVARYIHRNSRASSGRFVPVDCPALPVGLAERELFGHEIGAFTGAISSQPGLLDASQDGVLFLDEVGDLDDRVQAKLLRVLSSGEYRALGSGRVEELSTTLISATNVDLSGLIEAGRFRRDLYYRLGVELLVPPLRERVQDMLCLWEHFIDIYGHGAIEYEEGVADVLLRQPWRGNVRELEQLARRVVALSVGEQILESEVCDALGDRSGVRGGVAHAEGVVECRLAKAMRYISAAGRTTRGQYAKCIQVSARTALRDLTELTMRGAIMRVGAGRSTYYVPLSG